MGKQFDEWINIEAIIRERGPPKPVKKAPKYAGPRLKFRGHGTPRLHVVAAWNEERMEYLPEEDAPPMDPSRAEIFATSQTTSAFRHIFNGRCSCTRGLSYTLVMLSPLISMNGSRSRISVAKADNRHTEESENEHVPPRQSYADCTAELLARPSCGIFIHIYAMVARTQGL